MTAIAIAEPDVFAQLETLENQSTADYRQMVLAMASGAKIKATQIKAVCDAAKIETPTLRLHLDRMKRRHELAEQRREARQLIRKINEHKRELAEARKQYADIDRENACRLSEPSNKIRQHSRAIEDLQADQKALQSDATAELVSTCDPAISATIHQRIGERNELEKTRTKYQAEIDEKKGWRKQFANWDYGEEKVLYPGWHPSAGYLGLPRRMTQQEIAIAERRVSQAEQHIKMLAVEVERINERIPELNKEIDELNQKKFDPACMSWAD